MQMYSFSLSHNHQELKYTFLKVLRFIEYMSGVSNNVFQLYVLLYCVNLITYMTCEI